MKARTGKCSAAPGADGIGSGRHWLLTNHNAWSQEGEGSLGGIVSNGILELYSLLAFARMCCGVNKGHCNSTLPYVTALACRHQMENKEVSSVH